MEGSVGAFVGGGAIVDGVVVAIGNGVGALPIVEGVEMDGAVASGAGEGAVVGVSMDAGLGGSVWASADSAADGSGCLESISIWSEAVLLVVIVLTVVVGAVWRELQRSSTQRWGVLARAREYILPWRTAAIQRERLLSNETNQMAPWL